MNQPYIYPNPAAAAKSLQLCDPIWVSEFRKTASKMPWSNDDPICETANETHIKNRLLDSVEEGEGGMI